MQRPLLAVLLGALVVLAGCAGTTDLQSPAATTNVDTPATTNSETSTQTASSEPATQPSTDATRVVNFYVSDERNDINDFRHLNVTITQIGLHRIDTNESNTSSSNESGEWITHDVDNATVDLTRLTGAKATLITSFELPNGTYNKVFIYISDVNATLNATGESAHVKLPSGKLHLNKGFTINDNDSVDFVYDVSVHKAGKSGMYILKPVIGESGTDVPIEAVDDNGAGPPDDAPGKSGDAPGRSDNAPGQSDEKPDKAAETENDNNANDHDLNTTFVGPVSSGENATILVTQNGSAIENASVAVNGDSMGETNATGHFTFVVPETEDLEVTVTYQDDEVELEREFDDTDAT